jgi:hypothetical protein
VVDPAGKIFSEIKLIPISKLKISSYNPDFIGNAFSVTFLKDNSFEVKGKMEEISFDLSFRVALPPVTNKDIFIDVIQEQETTVKMVLAIKTSQGYQDHEGGCFDVGTAWGWDTGVVLCDPSAVNEPEGADFLIYRYGPTDSFSYGGVFVETKNGKKDFFDSGNIQIVTKGKYDGNLSIMPAITRLLYPDYHPTIPKTTTYIAAKGSDKLEITFTPKAVCSIVNASLITDSEVVFNEMFCEANLSAQIRGDTYDCVIPCWFESVRPRKRGGLLWG